MYFEDENSSGVLIEAKDLINGVSIVQAERVDKVEYFHVELETHDVIIAEGALSESFIDDDSRGMFHNAHEYAALYADDVRQPARYCAPRLDERLRSRSMCGSAIALRAGLLRAADPPRIGALDGHIDLASATRIAGWAQNSEQPEAPVCLDILVGGQLIGQVLANDTARIWSKPGWAADVTVSHSRRRRISPWRRTPSTSAARSMRRPYAARREELPCTGGQPGALQVNSQMPVTAARRRYCRHRPW